MKIDNFTPSEKIFEKRIAIEDEKKDGFGQVFKSALQAVNDKQTCFR